MAHEHWTSYWQTGVTDSFGAQLPKWYKDILEPFWQQVFQGLPDQSKILDVATGNGAVAKIALQVSSEANKNFNITASDKAQQDNSVARFKGSDSLNFIDRILALIQFAQLSIPQLNTDNLTFYGS